ncbi:ParB/RepB/Spo0J family partition protein [Pectobacterium brasiliense]|uniref:ParB/RepB/Spo0J family partition protein n=1 Tax=Pectobacterium brasiliense TaxID=180957 RepID=UPI001968FCF2|nr:ParB/RepB/Spo0J family partition protein [Pectobacterium brasiliense]MBN3262994.1 ParB/RepB/Spo0J family partition protein [Pectobacterium brasiliense]
MSGTQSKASTPKGQKSKSSAKKTAAEQAVEAALANAERVMLPLSSLVRTELNVRKKKHTQAQIENLAEGIASVGVIQNLAVYVTEAGKHAVAAGQGRFSALELLRDSGRISADYAVPALIVPEKIAKLISLMENVQRHDMHPFDQISAFGDERDQGKSAQEIGAFMGYPTKHVQKMLKLSVMHPQLLEQLAEDKIDVDQLHALASTDDAERQLQVWKNAGYSAYDRQPHVLRESVLKGEVKADDNPRLAIVGKDAYEAAGGAIRSDLFSESGFLSDAVLLDTLALDALNKAATETAARDGWKWGQGRFNAVPHWDDEFTQIYPHGSELTEDEEKEEERLDAELEELELYLANVTDADEVWETEKQIAVINGKLEAFSEEALAARSVWTDEQRQQGGVIAYLDGGEIKFQFVVAQKDTKSQSGSENDENDNNEQQNSATEPAKKGLSSKLICSLSSERTLAVQAALSQRPDVVIAAMLHDTIKTVFGDTPYHSKTLGVSVNVNRTSLISNAYDAAESKAALALNDMHSHWLATFPENWKQDFAWLMDWTLERQLALLAYCMTGSLDGVVHWAGKGGKVGEKLERIESAIDFNIADWWKPTKSNYFGRIGKDQIADDLRDADLSAFADSALKMKKGDGAELAENEIAKTDWLPACLLRDTAPHEPETPQIADATDVAESADTQPTITDLAA